VVRSAGRGRVIAAMRRWGCGRRRVPRETVEPHGRLHHIENVCAAGPLPGEQHQMNCSMEREIGETVGGYLLVSISRVELGLYEVERAAEC
jgi:hypothetical protein